MAQVFISYSRKDLAFVNQLAADLKKAGLNVWYDISGIGGGSRWRTEIESAIRNSEYVVVVLSPDSIVSEWVEREIIFSSNLQRKIIPLMYRSCELPLNYVNLEYVDVQGENYGRNFEKLLRALKTEVEKDALDEIKQRFQHKSQRAFLFGGIIILAALLGLYLVMNKNLFGSIPTETVVTETRPSLTSTVTPTTRPTETQVAPTSGPTGDVDKITDAQGVPMVLVEGGTFQMGSDQGGKSSPAYPAHIVNLSSFYIDKYEVTNKLYKACVDKGNCIPPKILSSNGGRNYYGNSNFEDFPVIYVTWDMANAYCSWREARLPTEAEWEKAARGTDSRIYPWGESNPDCSKANYKGCVGDTQKVGLSGMSPYGAYDMAGNVWEWVADWYQKDYYTLLGPIPLNPLGPATPSQPPEHVIRGGSWDWTSMQTWLRNSADLAQDTNMTKFGLTIGFRCVKNP